MNKQLTAADRKAIEILLNEKYTFSSIANKLKVDKSTICREVNNRSTPVGYFADTAQSDYETNREKTGRKKKLNLSITQNYVLSKIMEGWSPEQISGRMKLENRTDHLCMETIYSWIYSDPICVKDKIYQYLRLGKKRRTKHNGRKTKSLKILNKMSIHQRPLIVKAHEEYGHWEGDSVLFTHLNAINTLNELKTGKVRFTKLERKTAQLTADALIKVFSEEYVKTLTIDNGVEFMEHEKVSEQTGTLIYFCDPYCSCQRGSNENTNGLLRRYLPKRSDIRDVTQEDLDDIAWELNNRPRKRLKYLTPLEFYEEKVLNLRKASYVAFESRM